MVAKKKNIAKKKVAVKKKAAPKRAPAKKKVAVKKAVAAPAVKAVREPMTKAAIYNTIAENTGVSKKDVAAVFDELNNVINGHIKKRAAGSFTLPGLLKITTIKKPARKARKGVNPFTGEEMMFQAKPAQTVVKVRPLKKLKDYAAS
jgi:nucleoid DNA-binding protein